MNKRSFKPRNCKEKISRICTVKPIPSFHLLNKGLCNKNFSYYSSPKPTCLTKIYKNGHEGFKSGTRNEIIQFCHHLSGNLLGKGWIYIKNSIISFENIEIPLDLKSENYDNLMLFSDLLLVS